MFEYSGWNPYGTRQAAEEAVGEFMAGYTDDRFYGWAVEHAGALIGTVGAYDYDPESGSIELGCSIAQKYWGKGFGTEAIRAVLSYLTEQEGVCFVTAWCAADNAGSRRIMEKAGMVCTGAEQGALEIDGQRFDKMDYRYEREERKNSV